MLLLLYRTARNEFFTEVNMLLAFDIGNSSISVGIFELPLASMSVPCASFKISNKPYSSDEYTLYLKDFLSHFGCTDKIDSSVISSVVPNLTPIVQNSARDIAGREPFIISGGTKTGFGIKIKNPEQLGADIVCNVAAALHLVEPPLIILDMGTATTLTFVDRSSAVVGTIITPGLIVSLNALTDSAALLQNVNIDNETVLIGRDTEESINSGVINGNKFMIDGFIRSIRDQYIDKNSGEKLSLIATGGLAKHVIPYTMNRFVYSENLTLLGEAYLFERNTRKNFV